MKTEHTSVTLDQVSKIISGYEHAARWRVNAPPRPPQARRRDEPPPQGEDCFAKSRREAVCWRIARSIVLASMALCSTVAIASALDPALPPSGNFDLSHWKLTLPDASASEIAVTQLVAGYSNATYFYTGPDGAMTFWCPVTGGVTGNEAYPRCELRELIDPDNLIRNWTGYGTNTLNARCKVTKVPSSKTVVVGQIHGFTGLAPPLVKLQFNNGVVEALVKETYAGDDDTVWTFPNVGLSNVFSYQLDLTEGLLSVTVNGSNRTFNTFVADRRWTNQTFFFKAGNYCQDDSGSSTEGAIVAFYQLDTMHIGPVVSAPSVIIENFRINGGNQVGFTLLGQTPGSYFIQGSTDLINWDYLLITNSIAARVDFRDTIDPGPAGRRFYRGGSF